MTNWKQPEQKSAMKLASFRLTADEWRVIRAWCEMRRAIQPLEQQKHATLRAFFAPQIEARRREMMSPARGEKLQCTACLAWAQRDDMHAGANGTLICEACFTRVKYEMQRAELRNPAQDAALVEIDVPTYADAIAQMPDQLPAQQYDVSVAEIDGHVFAAPGPAPTLRCSACGKLTFRELTHVDKNFGILCGACYATVGAPVGIGVPLHGQTMAPCANCGASMPITISHGEMSGECPACGACFAAE